MSDYRNVNAVEGAASCSLCQVEVTLPKDDKTWPTKNRVLLDNGEWMESSPTKRREDGSLVPILPPFWDALFDFWTAHEHAEAGQR